MIEADVRERERDVQNWSNSYVGDTGATTCPWIQSSNDWLSDQDYNQTYKSGEEVSSNCSISAKQNCFVSSSLITEKSLA